MTRLRAERIARVEVPDLEVDDRRGRLAAGARLGVELRGDPGRGPGASREHGVSVAAAHLHHLNPLPANIGEVLRSYDRVLVPEMNMGQLVKILRAEYLVDVRELHEGRGPALLRRGARAGILRSGMTGTGSTGTARADADKADFSSDQETRWCPGCGDYAVLASVQSLHARAGHPARPDRVRDGHRLRGALRLLHGHVRDARHPRPRAGARHRRGHLAARPLGVGRER